MEIQIARIISRYVRGGAQMAQVVIHRGEGSDRTSETRHIALSTVKDGEKMRRIWVGNNPDPTMASQRENAAQVVAKVSTFYETIVWEIAGWEKLLKRSLTADELEISRLHGFSTETQAKESVEKTIIPSLKIQLISVKVACDTARAFQAEVNEAYPLTVEFVGV